MCYADGSLEQATSTCAMCKVFPPRNNYPCPHKDSMGVCKNRVNHPRHDVVHFRNAELSSFNGCGFCKWAKRHSKSLAADGAWKNPGWPGCCRPPRSNEYEVINVADWYAISKIHGIPTPAPSTPGGSPTQPHVVPNNKSPSNSPPLRSHPMTSPRALERRDSGSREPGSPHSSSAGRDFPSTSKSDAEVRRRTNSDTARRPDTLAPVRAPVVTREPSANVPRSPIRPTGSPRKDTEREGDTGKHLSEERDREKESRVATKTRNIDTAISTIRAPQYIPQHIQSSPPRSSNPGASKSSASSSSSSSSSSGSRGSVTQSGTVTSEGFTDYLSDESEAEMQREAERRAGEAELAAKLERSKLELGREEQEFRAARTQLASVGLQPPPAWSSGRLPVGPGKVSQGTVTHSSLSGPSRPSRSPGSMYGPHPTTSASYVEVYQSVRQ